MKKSLLFIIFNIVVLYLKAQNVNYSEVIDSASRDTAERLVVIAWRNNPDNLQIERTTEALKYDERGISKQWLNTVVGTANFNRNSLSTNNSNNFYYPIFNLGINVPLGIFWTQPAQSKAAHQRWKSSVEKVNSQKMDIRNKVLDAYQNYYLNRELLKYHNKSIENDYVDYLSKQNKFKNGEIPLEVYSAAESKYYGDLTTKLNLLHNFNISQYDLERLIGVRLEQAFQLMK